MIPYAPPGFPILVGIAYLLLGVGDHAAIGVSQVAGVLTIPVVGWLGRRTFGPGAGGASMDTDRQRCRERRDPVFHQRSF